MPYSKSVPSSAQRPLTPEEQAALQRVLLKALALAVVLAGVSLPLLLGHRYFGFPQWTLEGGVMVVCVGAMFVVLSFFWGLAREQRNLDGDGHIKQSQ